MITIVGTPEEFNALKQLLHRAVLHSGMEAADAAVFWNRKIQAAEVAAKKLNGIGTSITIDDIKSSLEQQSTN